MSKQPTGRAVCAVPGCERPAAPDRDGLGDCAEHAALFDARAEVEAWGLAFNILESWVRSAEHIGSPELSEAMHEALGHVDGNLDRARRRLEELERKEQHG